MAREHLDLIVVGAGQAGPALAARAAAEGWRVAVIERAEFGGTCVNNGCVPTKTLVATARALHLARRGAEFGFEGGEIRVDMARVMARKDSVVRASREGIEAWMRGLRQTEVLQGDARFTAPRVLMVGDRELTAERIVLNLGGRAVVPSLPGVHEVPTLDNRSVLELQVVPEHLAIVGGSYIGLEIAQVMRRLGASVTVLERSSRLLPREDDDAAAAVRAALEAEGIVLRTGTNCLSLARDGDAISVGAACTDGREPVVLASHVLLAVGRQPNTDGIGLDVAGIATDERGFIRVDGQCRSSAEGVWAVGDCNGRGAFTHTAWNDHEIVVDDWFGTGERRIEHRIGCYALFTDPPLARIGLNEAEAASIGRPLLRAKMPMARVGRAREAGETHGFMKALVDAESRQLLGATLVGMNADEVIHSLLLLMQTRQTLDVLLRSVPIHPTVSELLPTLMQQLRPWTPPVRDA